MKMSQKRGVLTTNKGFLQQDLGPLWTNLDLLRNSCLHLKAMALVSAIFDEFVKILRSKASQDAIKEISLNLVGVGNPRGRDISLEIGNNNHLRPDSIDAELGPQGHFQLLDFYLSKAGLVVVEDGL